MSQRSDKLKIIADALGYRIQWWLGNEPGGYLEKCATHHEEDDEHFVACSAARNAEVSHGHGYDWEGLIWSSKTDAQKALNAANAALEAHRSSKPYPEWAVKALAAGWKVPKGWKP